MPVKISAFNRGGQEKIHGTYGVGGGCQKCGFWIFFSWENIFSYAIYFLSSPLNIHFLTGYNTKKPQTDPLTIKETVFSNFSSLNMK